LGPRNPLSSERNRPNFLRNHRQPAHDRVARRRLPKIYADKPVIICASRNAALNTPKNQALMPEIAARFLAFTSPRESP
jgi:hypothetical protein